MLCGHDWRMLGFQVTRFYASTKFTGEKVGYVFKMGASGVGYYLDAPLKVSSFFFFSTLIIFFYTPFICTHIHAYIRRESGGEKVGYVFKMGASGVGYYFDAPPKVCAHTHTRTHAHTLEPLQSLEPGAQTQDHEE